MPKVPVFNTRQVQVRPESTPRPQTDGSEIGRAVQGIGNLLAENARRMQEEDSATEAKNAFNMLSGRYRSFLNGDGNADGFYAKRGKNAIDGYRSAEVALDKIDKEVGKTIKTRRASLAFEAMRLRKRVRSSENISRHVARERQTYNDETDAAMIKTSINDAAANYSDSKSVDDAILMGLSAIRSNAKGKGPEVTALQEAEFISAARKSVIKAMSGDSPTAARKYYQAHKKEIDGPSRPAIEKSLKSLVNTRTSQEKTDEIISKKGTLDEQLTMARKISDPDIRDETVSRVKVRFNEDAAARRESERQQNEDFWDTFLTEPDINKIPDDLPVATKKAAMVYAGQMAKGAGKVETDWNVYSHIMQLAADDPKAFREMDLSQYFSALSPATRKELIKAQTDDAEVTALRTTQQMIAQNLRAVGIDTGASASKNEQKKVAQFNRLFEENLRVLERETGKKATGEEKLKIIDHLLIEGEVDGSGFFYDDDKHLFQLEDDEFRDFIVDVPKKEKSKILEALKRAGIEPTEQNITRLYVVGKARK